MHQNQDVKYLHTYILKTSAGCFCSAECNIKYVPNAQPWIPFRASIHTNSAPRGSAQTFIKKLEVAPQLMASYLPGWESKITTLLKYIHRNSYGFFILARSLKTPKHVSQEVKIAEFISSLSARLEIHLGSDKKGNLEDMSS